jgi:hypothetical protein
MTSLQTVPLYGKHWPPVVDILVQDKTRQDTCLVLSCLETKQKRQNKDKKKDKAKPLSNLEKFTIVSTGKKENIGKLSLFSMLSNVKLRQKHFKKLKKLSHRNYPYRIYPDSRLYTALLCVNLIEFVIHTCPICDQGGL